MNNDINENINELKDEMTEESNNEQQSENKDEIKIELPPMQETGGENLTEKVAELEKELQEQKDKFLRKVAEFENFKRRTDNEQMNLLKYAAEPIIVKLLSVADDFERSLGHISDASDIEAVKKGVELIHSKLMKIFEEQGIKKIESLNQPFDFNLHEALLQRTVENVAPHTVVEEVESGYFYKDKVIRHSKVIVSDEESGGGSKDSEVKNGDEGREN